MKNLAIRRILVPIDLSARSADAAEYAQVVADRFNAELILLHVLEPLAADFAMTDPGLALMTDFMGKRKDEAEAALGRIGPAQGSGVRCLITQGDPAEQILES